NGLLKVIKKASVLLANNQVRTWKSLVEGLKEGEAQPATPRGKLVQMLPDSTKKTLRGIADPAKPTDEEREELRHGINLVLKDRQFTEAKEVQSVIAQPEFAQRIVDFPAKRKDFT